MPSLHDDAVEAALDQIRPSLAADGFDLRLVGKTGNTVELVLEAKPDACMDCLVPDEVLVQILEAAIRDEDPSLDRVVLTKSGFE